MTRNTLLALGLTCLAVLASGCVHPRHHRHRPAAIATLDAQHHDAALVVVHAKPKPARHCWKHRHHWHCHR